MYDTDSNMVNLDFSSSAENWYDAIDLTRLVAADNLIENIDKRIMEFDALIFVDVRDLSYRLLSFKLFVGDKRSANGAMLLYFSRNLV